MQSPGVSSTMQIHSTYLVVKDMASVVRCRVNVLYLMISIVVIISLVGRLLDTPLSSHQSPSKSGVPLPSPRPAPAPTLAKPSPVRKPNEAQRPAGNTRPVHVQNNVVNATFARLVQQIKEDIFRKSDSDYLTFANYLEFMDRVSQVRGIKAAPRSSLKRFRHEPACNKRRKRLIKEACATGAPHIKPAREWTNADARKYYQHLNNIVVDDKHKLLFCDIPKTGSTSWKITVALLTGRVLKQDLTKNNHLPVHSTQYMAQLGLYYLSSAHPTQIRKKLRRYYKLLMVRHPLDRLVSAYTDKFLHQDAYHQWYENMKRVIKSRYREEDADQNATVSFREFVNYAADDDSIKDRHWLSYQYLCGPCVVDYDYVMKVESLEQDASYVLPSIFKEPGVRTLPEAHSHRGANLARKAYKELREFFNVTTQETQRLVDGPYRWDLPMFGYRFDGETGRATCDKYTRKGQCC